MTKTEDSDRRVAIFSDILVTVGRTKLIFEPEPEFDGSHPHMEFERSPIKNDVSLSDHNSGRMDKSKTIELRQHSLKNTFFLKL